MKVANKINVKDFLIDNVLNISDNNSNQSFVDVRLAEIRKDIITKPIIFIGSGTCGLGAGADKTITETEKYLQENNIDADIIRTGCIGLCSAEPLMDIQVPGKTRISFQQVTGDKVEIILK